MRVFIAALAFSLAGCNEATKPVVYDEYECRSCDAGTYCPQFCTEKR